MGEWTALCGEQHPALDGKCVRLRGHHGMHNKGNGVTWMKYGAWDYIEDWYDEDSLPRTWSVIPPEYDYDIALHFVNGRQIYAI